MKFFTLVLIGIFFQSNINATEVFLNDINKNDQQELIAFLRKHVENRWEGESFYRFSKYVYLYREHLSHPRKAGYFYINLKDKYFKKLFGGHPRYIKVLEGQSSFSLYTTWESSHRGMISQAHYEYQCNYNNKCEEKQIYKRWEVLEEGGCGHTAKEQHMPITFAESILKKSFKNNTLLLKVKEEDCTTKEKKIYTIKHEFGKLLE